MYAETVIILDCCGTAFSTKGKTILSMGWKAYLEQKPQGKPLPDLFESMTFPVEGSAIQEGKTSPPRHFTEDTLLSAMETAGEEDYCDSVGFKELPDFRKENYLKSAEMSTEDDYGMLDGIINNGSNEQPTVAELERQAHSGQPFSLMDLADAVHREKKASVLEKLKDQPQPPRKSKPKNQKNRSFEHERFHL